VLVGPGGLVVVESRNWPGVVSLVDLPEASDTDPVGQAYALDGDVAALAARLEPAARKLRQVMARLGTDPSLTFGIVVFWGATQLPGEHVALTLRAPEGERAADVELVLLRGEHLADWFRRAPHRLSRREVRRLVRHATVDLPALH
jgi:hypothetical protein